MINDLIHFNRPFISGSELEYLKDSFNTRKLSGDGSYTKLCTEWLKKEYKTTALLTHSCTAALEMMALLLQPSPSLTPSLNSETRSNLPEIIMPSYTFVSTANAFVLRGMVPVFVDIRRDTLNIDEQLIEQSITENTKAICVVHYAGVGCEMDAILNIARKYNLKVFEDAAQGFDAFYKGQRLGTIGDLGALSFHETKNVISGEGGTLFVNNHHYFERAEIIREKGTNRSRFFRGQVDKYTWVDIGSSYLPSDMIAAFLYAQFEKHEYITKKRLRIWEMYHEFFSEYENAGIVRRPVIPAECTHNAHMYYVLFNSLKTRTLFIEYMKSRNILSVFHYIPLHSSPAGKQYGKTYFEMPVTNDISETLVRLPLYCEMDDETLAYIFDSITNFMRDQ